MSQEDGLKHHHTIWVTGWSKQRRGSMDPICSMGNLTVKGFVCWEVLGVYRTTLKPRGCKTSLPPESWVFPPVNRRLSPHFPLKVLGFGFLRFHTTTAGLFRMIFWPTMNSYRRFLESYLRNPTVSMKEEKCQKFQVFFCSRKTRFQWWVKTLWGAMDKKCGHVTRRHCWKTSRHARPLVPPSTMLFVGCL